MTTLPAGWKPIDSAPKDFSTEFDGWNGERVPNVIWAHPEYEAKGEYAWCRSVYVHGHGWEMERVLGLTHWMPHPAAPGTPPASAQPERDWELACDHCNGSGHVFVERQVAERKSDVQEFKEECECCEGRGFTIAYEDIPGIDEYVRKSRPVASAQDDAKDERQAFEAWLYLDQTQRDPDDMNKSEIELAREAFSAGLRKAAPAAGDARSTTINIEAAAKAMAECMDYPWAHMPEQGRATMREHAQTVIRAASQQQEG